MNEIKVTINGRIVRDIELKFSQNGKAYCQFTVASNKRVYRNGDWADGDTLWQRCVAFNRTAEMLADNCRKGTPVLVYGTLEPQTWENDKGEKQEWLQLVVESFGVVPVPQRQTQPTQYDATNNMAGQPLRAVPTPPQDDPWAGVNPW